MTINYFGQFGFKMSQVRRADIHLYQCSMNIANKLGHSLGPCSNMQSLYIAFKDDKSEEQEGVLKLNDQSLCIQSLSAVEHVAIIPKLDHALLQNVRSYSLFIIQHRTSSHCLHMYYSCYHCSCFCCRVIID